MSPHESKAKLEKQKQELKAYIKNARTGLVSQKNEPIQKMTEINEALKHKGELDPALKLNKNYRKGSPSSQAG